MRVETSESDHQRRRYGDDDRLGISRYHNRPKESMPINPKLQACKGIYQGYGNELIETVGEFHASIRYKNSIVNERVGEKTVRLSTRLRHLRKPEYRPIRRERHDNKASQRKDPRLGSTQTPA